MFDIVYLIWDVTNETKEEVVAVTDNDHDTLRFILAHNNIYPWKKGVKQDAHALWQALLDSKVATEELGDYFEGVEIQKFHANYDYLDEQWRDINIVADEADVDEFDFDEV